MKLIKTYKLKLKPTKEQSKKLSFYCDCTRILYNQMLLVCQELYEKEEKSMSYISMTYKIAEAKKVIKSLVDAPADSLEAACKDLSLAYQKFFRKEAKFPKGRMGSVYTFRVRHSIHIKKNGVNGKLKLPKMDYIKFRDKIDIEGKIKNVTVNFRVDSWYAAVQTEMEVPDPVPQNNAEVGIHMGGKNLMSLSTGEWIKGQKYYDAAKQKLRKLHRQLSKKEQGSYAYIKTKIQLGKLHDHILNQRLSFSHKLTSAIAKKYSFIAIEDIKIKDITKSAEKGTDKKTRLKIKLANQSILDDALYEARRQLEYKSLWQGGYVLAVPPDSAQKCAACGFISYGSAQKGYRFICESCGYTENSEVNKAWNILMRGNEILSSPPPVKPKKTTKKKKTVKETDPKNEE